MESFHCTEILKHTLEIVCGKTKEKPTENKELEIKKIKGTVKLMRKNVLDLNDMGASCLDWVYEVFGKRVTLQLISAVHGDPETGGKLGKPSSLGKWNSGMSVSAGEITLNISFEWDESIGVPGAIIIKNHHRNEFYLKTVTLQDVPGQRPIHFICNSWVYPASYYNYDRVFFVNKSYLPSNTPDQLRKYREEELLNLRGNGSGMRKEWDRVYDYAYYNDLGSPEKGSEHARPVLGGSELPYPRRGRTGRPPNKKDLNSESRLPLLSLNIYVPRDERFSHIKFSDFIAYAAKSLGQVLVSEIMSIDRTPTEFDTFEDVLKLYDSGVQLPEGKAKTKQPCGPLELLNELGRSDGERLFRLPMPDIIKEDKSAWRTDEEFGREMLAGINPMIIRSLQEFPPTSKLDPAVYGNQTSTIQREHIEKNMNGLTVDKAIQHNKLFILDHHDALMPYLERINTTDTKTYATRTILFLQDNGTLKPLAIELSLPQQQGDKQGVISQVFATADNGVEASLWQLAKAYAAVNDSGYHQLISHWLNTHAVIEPFVIATNRQLSVLHPIHKLLQPHFRDTMNINALARQTLINAGGILEMTVFPSKFALEMSASIYKDWVFTDQALPTDLLRRGVAVPDSSKHGVKLLIEDYPYAVDGLEIWSAIQTWVREYCFCYYNSDDMINDDSELQSWWTELRDLGHGDLKDKLWWPKMHTRDELVHTCTIIIWVASALHAAVNFGQYHYAGYLPNRPSMSRRFMPEPGTDDYTELESNPNKAFLKTITSQLQTLIGVSLIEILSRHSTDEIYLGQRDTTEWTSDAEPREAFEKFGKTLIEIEGRIMDRNNDQRWRNRVGPVQMPYNLLFPNTADTSKVGGLNVRGIPNSVSI